MGQLKGKTALVAGAGRNNGKAISIAFAREGADLIIVAREKQDALNEVVKECESLGAKVLPIMADVSDHQQVERLVQRGLDHFGLDPAAWLRDTLEKLPTCLNSQIDSLLSLRTETLHPATPSVNVAA